MVAALCSSQRFQIAQEKIMNAESVSLHNVVSSDEWLAARRELLNEEKQLTRQQQRVAAARRALPWMKVTKEYVFDTVGGRMRLADLFAGRSQLIVKHNMLNATNDVCVGCSFEMDAIEGARIHLEHHDVSIVAVSRAPLAKIQAAQKRMRWTTPWVSSADSDFNYDFHVSFTPEDIARGQVFYNYKFAPIKVDDLSGFSVFYKDEHGDIFHTYGTFGRGAEYVMTAYVFLDMTPKGRNETVRGNLTDWVRPHDRYDVPGAASPVGQFVAEESCCHGK
jgi:predicted dithiol-disulfide oxidoreductase (DUF899 family)